MIEIIVEEIPENAYWKLWHVDDHYKTHLGSVSYAMGAKELIYAVKELEDRWSSESKNLMHNSQVFLDNHVVYSDAPVPYIQMSLDEEEE